MNKKKNCEDTKIKRTCAITTLNISKRENKLLKKYLKEINPMNMKGLSKENVIKQLKSIINQDSHRYISILEISENVPGKGIIMPCRQ